MGALALITVAGTVGYTVMGFGVLDAIYQTVATVTTVGFRHPSGSGQTVFTLLLIVIGVGTALYTFSVLIEAFVEGDIGNVVGRRRMERTINEMKDHVVICGWGRVGQALARYVTGAGQQVVIIDQDPARVEGCPHPTVQGNATDDEVLRAAGIGRARVLAAALTTDSDNLYVTISGRALSPDLFIIARARVDSSEDKLTRAGANRVVNPQSIGGARMAAFALQPHVAEFMDVVMHDGSLEFRLEEMLVPFGSALDGMSLREAHLRDQTGALVLAIRDERTGRFTTNPEPESRIEAGQILIAIGTSAQLASLQEAVKR
jgi:voltage-gated potassium channel